MFSYYQSTDIVLPIPRFNDRNDGRYPKLHVKLLLTSYVSKGQFCDGGEGVKRGCEVKDQRRTNYGWEASGIAAGRG